MHVAVGVWLKSLCNIIRIVTSRHGDHTAACLKELSLTFKLLVIEKIPQSMVKIQVKYQQNWHLRDVMHCEFHVVSDKVPLLSSVEKERESNEYNIVKKLKKHKKHKKDKHRNKDGHYLT